MEYLLELLLTEEQIKVKCHNGDDTRMIMIDTTVGFNEFIKRLQDKFGHEKKIRCKVRDDDGGDGMIGLADQEDLDMVISTAKQNAKRERSDFGKMEVSTSNLKAIYFILTGYRFGSSKYNPSLEFISITIAVYPYFLLSLFFICPI